MSDTLRDGPQPHFAPEVVGPSFDTLGGEVQQPGTSRPGAPEGHMELHHEKRQPPGRVIDVGTDKFAVVSGMVDQAKAYQLLPANQFRRSAVIMCFLGPIFMGTQEAISNIVGQNYAAAAGGLPPNVFVLPASVVLGSPAVFAFEYTSRQGLYVCAASATPAQVQCMPEMFEKGTPIT